MGKGKWSIYKHEWDSVAKEIAAKLDKEQIDYAVGGEYALRFHGYALVMNYLEVLVNANDLVSK